MKGRGLSLVSTWRLCSRDAKRKTRIRQCDWLKLAGEKICREQVGTAPTFLSVRANKVAKWKIRFRNRGLQVEGRGSHVEGRGS